MRYFAFVLLLACGSVRAAPINAASLSHTDVQTAIQTATAGDTVVLPAGTGNWTSTVTDTLPANVTIIGAGTTATGGGDQTIIIDDISGGGRLLDLTIASTGTFRLSGITFQSGASTTPKDNGTVNISGPGTILIDHCRWNMTSSNNYKSLRLGDGIRGVIADSILDFRDLCAIYAYNGRSGVGEAQGNYEWTQPTAFGSNDFFFVEDCIINGSSSGTAYPTRVWDGFTAAKVVVRFNTLVQACLSETHDTGHSFDDRGARAQEAYCNSITSTLAKEPNFTMVTIGGGGAKVWGNAANNVYKNMFRLNVTRKNSETYAQDTPLAGWGYTGSPVATGTVNVSGNAVTHVSGDLFSTSWPASTMIRITGMTAEGVSGQAPPDGPAGWISSVNSTTSITLARGHTGANLTGATYYVGSNWDGNTTSTGYPAIDQPGRGAGDLLTGVFPSKINSTTGTIAWPNQVLEPLYIWKNTGSIVSGWSGSYVSNSGGSRVVVNRDYYIQTSEAQTAQTSPTSPFDGTTGVGWGTLANRPTTCTTGVAYWATDAGDWNQSTSNPYGVQQNGADGVLYVATDTDTWTEYYEPYTYPHPLRSAYSEPSTRNPGRKAKAGRVLSN